ncbi:MAG: hypothetical protein QGF90_03580 [Gammaproteobacteria bacterium]|nr:hypothetical protein [Gammaproteobacteria bacterium]
MSRNYSIGLIDEPAGRQCALTAELALGQSGLAVSKSGHILIQRIPMDGVAERTSPGDWYHVPACEEHVAKFLEDTAAIEFWFRA